MELSDDGKTLLKVTNNDIKKEGSYDIPEGVTSIGDWAFESCSSLQAITIPKEVASIGNGAFEDCSSLQTITIPEGVTSIGEGAFCGCRSLQAIAIPAGITSINNRVFRGCIDLQSITIPEGVVSIGNGAFSGCSGLQSITIPEGVVSIGDWTFENCSSLQSITIPEGVTSIGAFAFSYCSDLQSITIPEGVVSIGDWTFEYCSSLQSITIPEGVVSIGEGAFYNCSSLHSIMIAGKDTASIERITNLLPNDVRDKVLLKEVGEAAFQIHKHQLSRVALAPEINPLYRYFNAKAPYISKVEVEVEVKNKDGTKEIKIIEEECSKLPNDLFRYMNHFLVSESPYYKKANTRMSQVPLPKNQEELQAYENALERIVNESIIKATAFSQSLFLLLPKELRISLAQLKAVTLKKEDGKPDGYLNVADAIDTLHQKLLQSFEKTFPADLTQFKKECKEIIKEAHLVLVDEGYPPVAVTGQHFSFFKAEVAEKVSALEMTVQGLKNF
ncbi:leucine-rich repeat domain-containing protein [Legionella clemsonensis]|uniref:Leucine-rich repeat domain-containing protein n=1 Tax=Legionella clemsonensis TaxID=1867846 RepID=A0A222P1L3_9GAMM|nr:leucine-rich repeat domain-containing protein [Legionella clemsonensis]ASQ45730.1 hypothetical protein clem_05875 [Legionella clemsonensis]